MEPATSMVGRAQEYARLCATWQDVQQGGGAHLSLIGGEAGMGKTTLVETFARHAGLTGQVIHGPCVEYGPEGLPYAPIAHLLRDLVHVHGPDAVRAWAGTGAPVLAQLVPALRAPQASAVTGAATEAALGATPGEADTGLARLQLFDAVAAVLDGAARRRPMLLVIEDLHWSDQSSRRLLRFALTTMAACPVHMVITYRAEEVTGRHPVRPFLTEIARLPLAERLSLTGLSREETGDLVRRLTGDTPTSGRLDTYWERTEGVPFFVAELVHTCSLDGGPLPETLSDALLSRVAHLSEPARHLLRVAAVGGVVVPHDLLAAVLDLDSDAELDRRLRETVDAALLEPREDGYTFRHALVREVLHDTLLPGEHARLHSAYAEALAAAGPSAPLVHHLFAAHRLDDGSRTALTLAASGRLAAHESLGMYQRALAVWDRVDHPESVLGQRVVVLEKAARLAKRVGESQQAIALIRAAVDELGAGRDGEERLTLARLHTIEAEELSWLMHPERHAVAQRAIELAGSEPSGVLARALNALAVVQMLDGQPDLGLIAARRAVEVAIAAGEALHEVNARITVASCLIDLGREAVALDAAVEAMTAAQDHPRVLRRARVNYSDLLTKAYRLHEAVDVALLEFDAARAQGLEHTLGAIFAGNAAEPLLALGRWPQAERLLVRALDLDPSPHQRWHLEPLRAWLWVWQGDPEAATAALDPLDAAARAGRVGVQFLPMITRAVVDLALAQGHPDRAWAAVERYWQHPGSRTVIPSYPVIHGAARTARLLADPGRARERVRQVLEESPRDVTAAGVWRPVIHAELDDDEASWRAVLADQTLGSRQAVLVPYAGVGLGRVLAREGRRAEAVAVLDGARSAAAALGAGLVEQWAETLRHRLGGPDPVPGSSSDPGNGKGNGSGNGKGNGSGIGPGSGTRAVPDPRHPLTTLTPRERQVLALIAQGRSNGQIGRELFISTKTASVHVSNILAKIGASSRTEAAALALRTGLVG